MNPDFAIGGTTYTPAYLAALDEPLNRYLWHALGNYWVTDAPGRPIVQIKPSKEYCERHRIPANQLHRVATVRGEILSTKSTEGLRVKPVGLDLSDFCHALRIAHLASTEESRLAEYTSDDEVTRKVVYVAGKAYLLAIPRPYQADVSEPNGCDIYGTPTRCLNSGRRVWEKWTRPDLFRADGDPTRLADNSRNEQAVLTHLHQQLGEDSALSAWIVPPPIWSMGPTGAEPDRALLEIRKGDMLIWAQRFSRVEARSLSASDARKAARSILRILQALELAGVLHCDIKLDNLLAVTDPEQAAADATVCDFQLSDFGGALRIDHYPHETVSSQHCLPSMSIDYAPAADISRAVQMVKLRNEPADPVVRALQLEALCKTTLESQLQLLTLETHSDGPDTLSLESIVHALNRCQITDQESFTQSTEVPFDLATLQYVTEMRRRREVIANLKSIQLFCAGHTLFALLCKGIHPYIRHFDKTGRLAGEDNPERNRLDLIAHEVPEDVANLVLAMLEPTYPQRPTLDQLLHILDPDEGGGTSL